MAILQGDGQGRGAVEAALRGVEEHLDKRRLGFLGLAHLGRVFHGRVWCSDISYSTRSTVRILVSISTTIFGHLLFWFGKALICRVMRGEVFLFLVVVEAQVLAPGLWAQDAVCVRDAVDLGFAEFVADS